MQRNNNNASTKLNNTPVYKTFCKVCQDSGKLISEYTNHNVRDRSGKTTCPMLLAQECRNCFKKGHTVKYCSLLKAEPQQAAAKPVTKAKPIARAVPKNVFMVFDDDSESESDSETKDEPIQEFPALQAATLIATKKPVLNYGTIIDQVNDPEFALAVAQAKAKSKALALAEEQEAKRQQALAKAQAEKEELAKARDARIKANAGKKFSWADAESDSEGDEEEEEAYVAPKKAVKQIEDNSAW